ncbi:HAD superfamily hydrolase (TIGR01509 family)/HAD superfamily hydrolase (TIGR01549 family) [Streptomyces sp. KhCrAH-43]|uniref:HAD family hydrolase n=1 Tax=unclassified Streptomyces TaxID=2593676 RepID=UPI00035D8670|nr:MULTISPECIES: HAD-IA family hydrolase [unclassified Streptomyces]MYS37017.1 HAD-IA family hydrolase [Streptomyces sp. SID4920]MYX69488.1 HAD-IA family hydrolase [Streptomyces sp. SID8373]RAJ62341.1 HAD superfamily hydrolase (TIGR01509 family)/HAD superfamily hydrolase (TIGR01549 family) [Streptomyces sp. KhCrAH-43]
MPIKGVLFDFSGTLFRIESVRSWLAATLAERGVSVDATAFERYAAELEAFGALPGGPGPQRMPGELADVWAHRDESAELHRAAFTGLARQVPLPDEGLYDALYDRHLSPDAWRPYPDAAEVLAGLREAGVRIGVVSNIGWDLRPVFRAHGLDRYVDAYVLSFEHGVQKPDARLFHTACTLLGQDPADVVMVGDDREADGGAAALGCEVRFVRHLPVRERPYGLLELGLTEKVA